MAYQEESFLGSGDLNIDVYDSSGDLTGELDVGNATLFQINAPTLEKKELIGMRQENYAETIKSVITKSEQELKFTLTDINRENLALAMFGTDSAYTQTAGNNIGSEESIVAHSDKWTKLTYRKLDEANPPVVKDVTDTTTYTEDTDYEVDYEEGRIKMLSTGSISDGDTLHVGSTWLGITGGFKVTANDVNKFECLIRLIGQDQANDRECRVVVHKAQIEPSGDINWLTEDFAQLEFTGKILSTTDGTWDVTVYS